MSGEGTTTTASFELASDPYSFVNVLPPSDPTNLPELDGTKTDLSTTTPNDGTEGVGTLEWAQVIELQAFSERKVWIEEKTRVSTILGFSEDSPVGKTKAFSSYWKECLR
jgi:hypothetical protein